MHRHFKIEGPFCKRQLRDSVGRLWFCISTDKRVNAVVVLF